MTRKSGVLTINLDLLARLLNLPEGAQIEAVVPGDDDGRLHLWIFGERMPERDPATPPVIPRVELVIETTNDGTKAAAHFKHDPDRTWPFKAFYK